MKDLIFESILMRSKRGRKALNLSFHPKKNLLVGPNHVGKSSLIKTIFVTLGAAPKGKLHSWDIHTESLINLKLDGRLISIFHHDGYRAIFENGTHIISTGDSKEWVVAFRDVFGFNLTLTNKSDATSFADPKCFFIPFYINQDGSWGGSWDTFTGLQQFSNPIQSILEYFSGVKPAAFYEAQNAKKQVDKILDELKRELKFLDRARERLSKSFPLDGPRTDPEVFEMDLGRLSETVTDLNKQQEKIRDQVVREQELIDSIRHQIHSADHALAAYRGDASYLSQERGKLICPTCNAEHSEQFMELLGFAEDARVLQELIIKLKKDLTTALDKHHVSRSDLRELTINYEKVSSVLEVRRGELRLGDVIQSMGAESAVRALDSEAVPLKSDIETEQAKSDKLQAEMNRLTDREKSKAILSDFRTAYAGALTKLNMPSTDLSKTRLNSRPDLSGSGGPRSVLAYYYALWSICRGIHGDYRIPLVIDAPNQQGQDGENLPAVLKFLAQELPNDAQVIVGAEVSTGQIFDKHIELGTKYSLLDPAEFESVSKIIEQYATAMYESLLHSQSE